MSRQRRVGPVIALNGIAKGLENGMAGAGRHLRALFQDFSRIAVAGQKASGVTRAPWSRSPH